VYADDLDIISSQLDIGEACNQLIMMEFELKDLGRTKF
jgi:hypothetical protein